MNVKKRDVQAATLDQGHFLPIQERKEKNVSIGKQWRFTHETSSYGVLELKEQLEVSICSSA